jgi:hypothetical protein
LAKERDQETRELMSLKTKKKTRKDESDFEKNQMDFLKMKKCSILNKKLTGCN